MNSQALDYFPFDTDFFENDKVQLVEGEFGEKGGYVAVRLLCKIFGTKGYYYQWGEDECLLLTKKLGSSFTPSLVESIVRGLVRRRFFDKDIFESCGCLTSEELQHRYFEGARKRKTVKVRKDLLLVDVASYKNVVVFNEKGDFFNENGDVFQQSKVKESKAKESNSPSLSSPPEGSAKIIPGSKEEQQKIVYFFTFDRNWAAPNKEYFRLKSYNDEPGKAGWSNLASEKRSEYTERWSAENSGIRFKLDKDSKTNDELLHCWRNVFDELVRQGASLDLQLDALSDKLDFKRKGTHLELKCTRALHDFIEQDYVLDAIKPIIWPYIKSHGYNGLDYDDKDWNK